MEKIYADRIRAAKEGQLLSIDIMKEIMLQPFLECCINDCLASNGAQPSDGWFILNTGELYCPAHVPRKFNLHRCKLCGVHCTTDECDTCKQIPQSHPYRNRVPERIVTDLCNGPLEIQTVEERNKYRRTS